MLFQREAKSSIGVIQRHARGQGFAYASAVFNSEASTACGRRPSEQAKYQFSGMLLFDIPIFVHMASFEYSFKIVPMIKGCTIYPHIQGGKQIYFKDKEAKAVAKARNRHKFRICFLRFGILFRAYFLGDSFSFSSKTSQRA